jgi:hypothetical protein
LIDPGGNKIRDVSMVALVEPFDAAAAVKKLKELGAKAELSRNGSLPEFYDPQGIRLQVMTGAPPANR